MDITSRSLYSITPRGFGVTSFRLYEAMQLGTVPVYISDQHWLPWQDELNWNEFCVIIKPEQIADLYDILLENLRYGEYRKMLDKIKEIYPKYFTLEAVCQNILKRL
jgi:hypothetical protein